MLARYKEHFCISTGACEFWTGWHFYQVTVILNCAVMPRVNKKGVKTAVKDSIYGFNANRHKLEFYLMDFLSTASIAISCIDLAVHALMVSFAYLLSGLFMQIQHDTPKLCRTAVTWRRMYIVGQVSVTLSYQGICEFQCFSTTVWLYLAHIVALHKSFYTLQDAESKWQSCFSTL